MPEVSSWFSAPHPHAQCTKSAKPSMHALYILDSVAHVHSNWVTIFSMIPLRTAHLILATNGRAMNKMLLLILHDTLLTASSLIEEFERNEQQQELVMLAVSSNQPWCHGTMPYLPSYSHSGYSWPYNYMNTSTSEGEEDKENNTHQY